MNFKARTVVSLCGNGVDVKEELIWFNVRPPTRFYAAREKEMEIIGKEWAECLKKKMMLFVAITGRVGIGKSELAAYYAKHFHESTKGHCIWIDAESNQTLLQSFQNLATKLKTSLKDQSGQVKELNLLVQQIHEKLRGKKCLYIFDNLDSYEQPSIQLLEKLASQQGPSVLKPFVLMTSRFQPATKYFGNKCKSLPLDVLNHEAAFQFFRNSLEIEEDFVLVGTVDKNIRRLCYSLNNFPMAMQKAAAYINENLPHGSDRDISKILEIEKYGEKIDIQRKKQNKAAGRYKKGEYSDALKIFREVLDVRERMLYVNHPDTLDTKEWVACTYECLGRMENAIELYKEVLEKRKEILGPEHPDTLFTKKKLATAIIRQNQPEKRENVIVEPEHPVGTKSKKNAREKNKKCSIS